MIPYNDFRQFFPLSPSVGQQLSHFWAIPGALFCSTILILKRLQLYNEKDTDYSFIEVSATKPNSRLDYQTNDPFRYSRMALVISALLFSNYIQFYGSEAISEAANLIFKAPFDLFGTGEVSTPAVTGVS